MDAGTRREIEGAIREALAPFGIAGEVVVRGAQVELHAGASPIAIDMDLVGEQWPLLPVEMRQRKATELARRLAEAARRARASMVPARGAAKGLPPVVMAAVAVIVVGALAAFVFTRKRAAKAQEEVARAEAAAASIESPEQSSARRARVCEATRRRIYAGASIGPFDTDGWVGELWLARKGGEKRLRDHDAVTKLVKDGKLTAAADADLAKIAIGAVEITEPQATPKGHQAVLLRFSGGYLNAFLEPAGRARFLSMADRAAEGSGAEMGALYAMCSHLSTHEIGAWFFGSDAASAATALLYTMGLFAETPAVKRSRLAAGSELEAIRASSGSLDNGTLGGLVGTNGGSLTPRGSSVTLAFPLGGPIRATSASREVARYVKVD